MKLAFGLQSQVFKLSATSTFFTGRSQSYLLCTVSVVFKSLYSRAEFKQGFTIFQGIKHNTSYIILLFPLFVLCMLEYEQ